MDFRQLAEQIQEVLRQKQQLPNDLLLHHLQQLLQAYNSLLSLYDSAPIGFVLHDQSGIISCANPAFCSMTGTSQPELIGKTVGSFLTNESCRLFQEHLSKLDFEKRICKIRLRFSHPAILPCIVHSWRADDSADPSYYSAFLTPAPSEIFQQSGDNLLTPSLSEPAYQYEFTPNSRFTYVNPALCQMTGYTAEEFYADSELERTIIHPEDLPFVLDRINRKEYQEAGPLTIRLMRKDGTTIWTEQYFHPFSDEAGNVIAVDGFVRETTSVEKEKRQLEEVAEQYHRVFNGTQAAMFILEVNEDGSFQFIQSNRAHEEKTGILRSQLARKTPKELLGEILGEQVEKNYRKCISSGEMVVYEEELLLPNGKRTWMTELTPVIEKGKPLMVIGSSIDITALKQVERAQKKTQKWVRNVLEAAPTGIGVIRHGVVREANNKTCEITGRTKEELLGRPIEEIFQTLDAPLVESMESDPIETSCVKPDGTIVDVLFIKSPVQIREAIEGYIFSVMDITERKRTDKELRESEERFRSLYENATLGIYRTTPDGRVLLANPALVEMLGYDSLDDLAARNLETDGYAENTSRQEFIHTIEQEGSVRGFNATWKHKDGSPIFIRESAKAVKDPNGRTLYYEGTVENITEQVKTEREREELQQQLFQTQKMESVGRLAGGVAHDFNNMLGVILGYSEMALEQVVPESSLYEFLQEIHQAARRSGNLTRQLLTFARKQSIRPEVININQVISSMLNMLDIMLGEGVKLLFHPGERLWPVEMDPSQLNQVMTNLLANARDAIVHSGTVTISTRNIPGGDEYSKDTVLICIEDTGSGMSAEVQEKLFEPYFTTKELGKGTGLGLSSVLGTVTQNGGSIDVKSTLGEGTTFFIYLPRTHQKDQQNLPIKPQQNAIVQRTGTILFVEDEQSVLELGEKILTAKGFTVLTATSTSEALHIVQNHSQEISLLITDVIMPAMNGKDLREEIRKIIPDIKTLFISGYSADVVSLQDTEGDPTSDFLTKPFSVGELTWKVRELLKP